MKWSFLKQDKTLNFLNFIILWNLFLSNGVLTFTFSQWLPIPFLQKHFILNITIPGSCLIKTYVPCTPLFNFFKFFSPDMFNLPNEEVEDVPLQAHWGGLCCQPKSESIKEAAYRHRYLLYQFRLVLFRAVNPNTLILDPAIYRDTETFLLEKCRQWIKRRQLTTIYSTGSEQQAYFLHLNIKFWWQIITRLKPGSLNQKIKKST